LMRRDALADQAFGEGAIAFVDEENQQSLGVVISQSHFADKDIVKSITVEVGDDQAGQIKQIRTQQNVIIIRSHKHCAPCLGRLITFSQNNVLDPVFVKVTNRHSGQAKVFCQWLIGPSSISLLTENL